jgi:hypothetical protein
MMTRYIVYPYLDNCPLSLTLNTGRAMEQGGGALVVMARRGSTGGASRNAPPLI